MVSERFTIHQNGSTDNFLAQFAGCGVGSFNDFRWALGSNTCRGLLDEYGIAVALVGFHGALNDTICALLSV
jgi:hypothetical protein